MINKRPVGFFLILIGLPGFFHSLANFEDGDHRAFYGRDGDGDPSERSRIVFGISTSIIIVGGYLLIKGDDEA
ncbi:hypothetical protein C0431_11265 [bacterium]|nr:hypothetical protein [bacterium]